MVKNSHLFLLVGVVMGFGLTFKQGRKGATRKYRI